MNLIYTVPQNHVVLIKRFGRHSRVQRDGLRFKLPFIESIQEVEWYDVITNEIVANKKGYQIELSEQQTLTPIRQCQSRDNVTIKAATSIYWRITDPVKAVYDIDNLPKSIGDIALNALRACIGEISFDQVLTERQNLTEKIAAQLYDTASKWGVTFTRVEIQEIGYDDDTATAMLQEMTAERKKRSLIAEAEGEAKAIETKAKAQAEAIKIIAEAEGAYISKLKENTSPEIAGQIVMSQKYIDGMNAISKNDADKVFLPNSFQGMFEISTNKN